MAGQTKSKLTLFLMELLMVILFFSVCAAICVGVFGGAQKLAVQSDERNRAVVEIRNGASCFKASEGDLKQTAEWMGGAFRDNYAVRYYNKEWKPCNEAESVYRLVVQQEETVGEAIVYVSKETGTICEIKVKAHSGRAQ